MSTTDSNQSAAAKIGRYVAYQREKRGYSIEKLAKLSDLNPSFIFRLEKGAYTTIKLTVLEKLAKALRMSLQSFLFKCEIITSSEELPSLEYYLKEKYQFSPEAIDEVRTFISFIHFKHDKEITHLKKIHEEYWAQLDDQEE